jgi:hypothetical protein
MLNGSVEGLTTATAAAADNAIAVLWNLSTTKTIWVRQVHIFKQGAVGAVNDIARIRRVSARGTQTTSFVPGIEHDLDHALAPPSGLSLDTAWSVQPTFAGTAGKGLVGSDIPNAQGSGFMWTFDIPVAVKALAGLAIVTGVAQAFPVSNAVWAWSEA